MSAGLGDILVEVMDAFDVYHRSNTKVVSNFLAYDDTGKVIGIAGEMIHVYNKNESAIHDSEYLHALNNNSGIASPTPLTKSDLERQVDLLMTAPNDQSMTLHRGQFKEGQLQVFTSFDITCEKTNRQVQFWWKIGLYNGTDDLIRQILSERIIPVTGTPYQILP